LSRPDRPGTVQSHADGALARSVPSSQAAHLTSRRSRRSP
jgi:hypothetical protein